MNALVLDVGPQLFIDDYLIGEQSFLNRTVNNPPCLPEPVVTGGSQGGDQCFQPYLTVLRDPTSGRFRMWYGVPEHSQQSHIAYLESYDGIHWQRPHRVLADPHPIIFGISVVDQGMACADPQQRYLFGAYNDDGLMLSTSPDGLHWRALQAGAVLKHNHDINSLHWDPIRQHYLAIVSVMQRSDRWQGERRIPHQSVSQDLLHWAEPWPIIHPKIGAPLEMGEMEFYSMSGIIARGSLLVGLVKTLRDDCNATAGKSGRDMGDFDRKVAGLGYTVLAWSRDGRTWQRDHEPFLPRNPRPGSWDHAMVWGDEQIVVGDETYLYYGGYARGHKVARFTERQIGLARMLRDRYVAREADLNLGHLRTKPLQLQGTALTVNANIIGTLRLRLLDAQGEPLPGFGWVELKGDSVAHPVAWGQNLAQVADRPVQLQFELRDAQLFGFDLRK